MTLKSDFARIQQLASHHPASASIVDAHWMSSWLTGFAAPGAFLVCVLEEDALVGVAAMQYVERRQGLVLRLVQSLTNLESYRFEFLAAHRRAEIARDMWCALCGSRRADVIKLDHVPVSSPTLSAGLDVARQQGWRAVVEDTFLTPLRALSTAEPWDHGLTAKFKSNLRNRERRLSMGGPVGFEMITRQEDLHGAFETFCRLEASGWKGERGTAISQQPDVRRFYQELLARAGDDMRIAVLTVAGVPVAAQLLRICGRTIFMLKTAYNEAYAHMTPGQLLTARVIRYGIDHNMAGLDFLADNATWKSDWADAFLPHRRLVLFAPTLAGRCAYWAWYGIADCVKRAPGARRLVRWIRHQRS